MTALTVIQRACGRLSLDIPAAVFSSTNDQVIQLRNLMNEEIIDLSRRHDWTRLQTEKTFTTVAQAVQTSAVPADFDRYINGTMFNRTTVRKVIGPLTAAEWQQEKAGPIYSSVSDAFRFRGGDIIITPNPTAGETVAYEYITKYRVLDVSANQDQEVYVADDDYAALDEELVCQGVIWRFKQRKGLDYSEDYSTYEENVEKAIGRDGGKKIINLTSAGLGRAYGANIPDGSWS